MQQVHMGKDVLLDNLEHAIFKEKTDRTSLDEERVASKFENASNVEASVGTSRHREL